MNFLVPQGKIIGIIGRSGAGKSTLLRCLNGLETPDQGEIFINGQLLTTPPQFQLLQEIGTIFQNFNLLRRRTVIENIAFPLELQNISKADRYKRAVHIARRVGLAHKLNAYPCQLSGGQKQRVAIARALVSNVKLLLCDEFTSALDPETCLEILELLKELNQKLGIAILLITHDMGVIREICDEVIVLSRGQIIESGSLEDILLTPKTSQTKSLLRNLLNRDLPHHLQKKLQSSPIPNGTAFLRLVFSGEAAQKPIVATLIEQYDVPVNIIAGNLDHIRALAFGVLVIAMPYHEQKLKNVQNYLKSNNVSVEVLGYGAIPW
ncbi:methionine ABC transporter ATP-binding protein [Candidatus Nucleicultrix amoebiphila]|uniref:methionine ABC transporter ATP-binding protein n=1 Tax=Candidatus Nucleicultrix amoebiphila TaxID=1509244 RepID=UPI0022B745C2|nr:ATP-binding cassette domain-containing protein [Candidatus Nucleicultrix amoebiphila]